MRIIILVLFVLLILISSCNEEKLTPPTEELYIIEGVIFDSSSEEPIVNAKLYIDGSIVDTTNSNGLFRIENIDNQKHLLSIVCANYETLYKEITLTSNSYFTLYLKRIYDDYFPINSINYDFNFSFWPHSTNGLSRYGSGTAMWQRISSYDSLDMRVSAMEEIKQYIDTVLTINENTGELDTTITTINNTSHFIIIEDSVNNQISFDRFYQNRKIVFPRYFPSNEDSVLSIEQENPFLSIKLVRDKGISLIKYSYLLGNSPGEWQYARKY